MASHVGRDGRRAPHHVATALRGSAPIGTAWFDRHHLVWLDVRTTAEA
ncbi:unnamed protein product, partial [Musa acuminata subsp. burmannicoides]